MLDENTCEESEAREPMADPVDEAAQDPAGEPVDATQEPQDELKDGEARKGPKRKKAVIAIVIVLLGLIIGVVVSSAVFLNVGKSNLLSNGIQNASTRVVTYEGQRYRMKEGVTSICIVGSDADNGIAGEHNEGFFAQADAIFVLALDTNTHEMSCITIPRNTMVDINLQRDGIFYRTDYLQICLAYAMADSAEEAAAQLQTAISRLFLNTPMNHSFSVSLACVDELADALDGVEVQALETIPATDIAKGDTVTLRGKKGDQLIGYTDEEAGIDWVEGTAAWYVRYRDMHSATSPLDRQARQMQFAKALAEKVKQRALRTPTILLDLYDIAMKYTDTDLDLPEIAYLASEVVPNVSSLEFVGLEGEMVYNDESEWGQFIPDKDALYELILDVYYEPVE